MPPSSTAGPAGSSTGRHGSRTSGGAERQQGYVGPWSALEAVSAARAGSLACVTGLHPWLGLGPRAGYHVSQAHHFPPLCNRCSIWGAEEDTSRELVEGGVYKVTHLAPSPKAQR